jgi:hypothetical protein
MVEPAVFCGLEADSGRADGVMGISIEGEGSNLWKSAFGGGPDGIFVTVLWSEAEEEIS